ncbi:MAG: CarD family transcriptional regulator [Candidatus Eiseniibacteriota bacterium]|jgi:RNA polymerase-interacting CarD/CdnL/TRCF family regulator
MQFTVGQRIVHPRYGLGVINRIEMTDLMGEKARCLKIHFPQNNTRILVPVEHADGLNMRCPMTPSEVKEVFSGLRRRARTLSKLRPRDRVKIYKPIIERGRPVDLVAVIRDLGRFGQSRRLTDEEQEMLTSSIDTLAREVALADGRDVPAVRREIETVIER